MASDAAFDVNSPQFDIKAVLATTDVTKVRSTVNQLGELDLKDDVQIEQNFKVQILLWNRVLALYEAQKSTDDAIRKEQVECYHQVSKLWANLEDRSKALAQLHRAMQVFPAGSANETIVDTLQFLGETHLDSGEYAEAIDCHRKAIAMLGTIGGDAVSQEKLALAHGELAAVYESQGDYDEAVKELQMAKDQLPAIDEGDDEEDGDEDEDYFAGDDGVDATKKVQEATYCQLGSLYFKTANYNEAVVVLTPAVRLLQQLRGGDHPKTKEYAYLLDMASNLAE